MEANETNESLKNFQTDSSQRIYHLSRPCPRCGLSIAIGYETHLMTCPVKTMEVEPEISHPKSHPINIFSTEKLEDEPDPKSQPNISKPSALIKKLSSSVAPKYFVPPKTQSALQTVVDTFSDHFMDQLLKRKQWVTKRNTVRPEDIWATLETEDFDFLANRMRVKNCIPKYDAPGNVTNKQMHMPVESVNEFFLEDEQEEEITINPFFLR